MTQTDLALAVSDVTKTYGALKALDAMSFGIMRGAVMALLGPNGAGKTTLFQLLTGLFVPDSGRIEVFGHDISREPSAALARLGIVFQQSALDLDLTASQNLRFHGGLHGMTRAAIRVAETKALAQFRIADIADKQVRDLSGGTRRKVELARALMTDPDLLLLDEPSQGLDTHSRVELVRDVFTLARERNIAVLWATHIVSEVEAADRVIVLAKGHVVTEASPAGLLEQAGATTLEQAFLTLTRAPAPAA